MHIVVGYLGTIKQELYKKVLDSGTRNSDGVNRLGGVKFYG